MHILMLHHIQRHLAKMENFSNCSPNAFTRTFNFNYWNCQASLKRIERGGRCGCDCNLTFLYACLDSILQLITSSGWNWFFLALNCDGMQTRRVKTRRENGNWKKAEGVVAQRENVKYFIAKYCFIFGYYLNNFALWRYQAISSLRRLKTGGKIIIYCRPHYRRKKRRFA